MDSYEILPLLHIAFASVWIGAGIHFHVLAYRADGANDEASIARIVRRRTSSRGE